MTVQMKQSTSTITTMEDDIKTTTHGVSSPADHIQFHHETEQQDAFELARKKNFVLDIPEESPQSRTRVRIVRKSYAIACQTTTSKERILEHLQEVFYKRIRYICISSPRNPSSNPCAVYIQIIFGEVMSMNNYFMKRVTGMRCNCRVTCDDRAWNQFLKKVGPCLELGDFRAARSRVVPILCGVTQQKQRGRKKKLKKSTTCSSTTKTVVPVVDDTATNVTSDVKPNLGETIDIAFEHIAAECARQRELLIQQFASNHNAQ